MAKVKKWIGSAEKKPKPEYSEAKREFEMAIGKPFIRIRVEIPKGFEDLRLLGHWRRLTLTIISLERFTIRQ